MNPSVCIILVNTNQKDDTIDCLYSLAKLEYPCFKIVVSDNGSVDGSTYEINNLFPGVVVIQNKQNLGYAEANNIAIEWANQRDYDFVFLLNNDTIVHPSVLKELIKVASQNDLIGVLGPQIRYYNDPECIWFGGGYINLKKGRVKHIELKELDHSREGGIYETDYITGCAMLLSLAVLKDVGLLDNKYFIYCEDADICLRIRQRGWKSIYVPQGIVWHKTEFWTKRNIHSGWRTYYETRNILYLMKKFMVPHIAIINKIFKMIVNTIHWTISGETLKIFFPMLRGIADFYRNRMGCQLYY